MRFSVQGLPVLGFWVSDYAFLGLGLKGCSVRAEGSSNLGPGDWGEESGYVGHKHEEIDIDDEDVHRHSYRHIDILIYVQI